MKSLVENVHFTWWDIYQENLLLTDMDFQLRMNNYIHEKQLDAVTDSRPNFNEDSVKPPPKLGLRWIITAHIKLSM